MTLQSFNNKILQYYLEENLKLTNQLILLCKNLHLNQLKYAVPNVEINTINLCMCYQNEQYRKLIINQFVSPRTQAINIILTFEGQQE